MSQEVVVLGGAETGLRHCTQAARQHALDGQCERSLQGKLGAHSPQPLEGRGWGELRRI